MIPTLHIHLLDDFLLVSDDAPVMSISSPRLQSLFAYLVLHRTTPQNRSHLAFLLWPDSTEEHAHASLRKLLYQLHQALPDIDHFLRTNRQSLFWQPVADSSWTLDVQDFEQALAQATQAEQRQNMSAMRQALEQAVDLYRGTLLSSCYDEWIVPVRDSIRQLFFRAAERLIGLLEDEQAYDAAIEIARRLLHDDPLHEATYRQIMRLYALHGDRAAALRVYHMCATVLERELETEPSEITRAVYESLVQSDAPPETMADALTLRVEVPLLGRKEEWLRLQEAWRMAGGIPVPHIGHPHIVILTGEAGIGKTRLAEEMEMRVNRLGMATASARCYAAEGRLAYAPVTTWLRTDALRTGFSALDPVWLTEIARLVPEVLAKRPQLPRPTPMTEGWQRQHFFEALARAVLSARQPLLLLLDDLHWCDNETLEWMHYLLRFESEARILLIGTVRSEETLPGHPLVAFLSTLQREGLVTEMALGPLTTAETTSLAEYILGRRLDVAMSNILHHETEGNPLFVVEMARAGTLGQRGRGHPDAKSPSPLLTHPASTLPPLVQNVLATRFAQLSPLAREMANAAAVIGREFPFSVLARASGECEESVVRGLDELWQRRIVREGATETYDFSHDKLREQAYASLGPAHRRLLHRRVADAFKAIHEEDLDAFSGQVAAHYEHAGLPEQAIPFYQRAGEVAAHIYANLEAIQAFERAAALLEAHVLGRTRQEAPWETTVQVYESLGDISAEVGRYPEARCAYQRAITFVPGQTHLWQACLQRKIANTWNLASTNPYDTVPVNVRQAFQEAERILAYALDPLSPAWQYEWIELQFAQIWPPMRWSADDMTAAIEKARPMVEQHGTEEQREFLSYAIATRDFIRNRYVTSALEMSEQRMSSRRDTVAAIQQTGNKRKLGVYQLAFGITLWCADHLDEAEEQLENALHVGEQIGSARLQTHCLTFLPFIFRRRGQVEQVRNILTRAQSVGATRNNCILTGHRAWVAWRDGNLAEAEICGRDSQGDWQREPRVNAFFWTGLWPLVGVALARKKLPEALDHLRMLLDPSQQPPPEPLSVLLEMALQAWDAQQQEEAHTLLQQAAPLAEKLGYL